MGGGVRTDVGSNLEVDEGRVVVAPAARAEAQRVSLLHLAQHPGEGAAQAAQLGGGAVHGAAGAGAGRRVGRGTGGGVPARPLLLLLRAAPRARGRGAARAC